MAITPTARCYFSADIRTKTSGKTLKMAPVVLENPKRKIRIFKNFFNLNKTRAYHNYTTSSDNQTTYLINLN